MVGWLIDRLGFGGSSANGLCDFPFQPHFASLWFFFAFLRLLSSPCFVWRDIAWLVGWEVLFVCMIQAPFTLRLSAILVSVRGCQVAGQVVNFHMAPRRDESEQHHGRGLGPTRRLL